MVNDIHLILDHVKAFRFGHFVLTGSNVPEGLGPHSDEYVNKDALYMYPKLLRTVCLQLALRAEKVKPDMVIGPAMGGIKLADRVAESLMDLTGRSDILALYAEKSGDDFVIGRGMDQVIEGKTVLVVEDVLTTGGTVRRLVHEVRSKGGIVKKVVAIVNRGNVGCNDMDVEEHAHLVTLENVKQWPADQCPLCKKEISIDTNFGKGTAFLALQKA